MKSRTALWMRVPEFPAPQVRWAKQSLERLRVGSWRGHRDGSGGGSRLRTRSALALQREMLHTVTALHQFVCDRVVQSASKELARVSCSLHKTCLVTVPDPMLH